MSAIRIALTGLSLAIAVVAPALAQPAPVVTIATVMSVPSVATFIARERGYFRDAGVEVRSEAIDTLSKANALLATNQIQLAQGGINAGFFNAVGQGLPIVLALESGSTPVYHNFIVRSDLKDVIRAPSDLKGRNVAISGIGSLSLYELGAVLSSAGLRIADVNVKIIAFSQMGAAMANKSLDVGLMVAPFSDMTIAQGIGAPWIDPEKGGYVKVQPLTSLGYLASADWIKTNPAVAGRVVKALLRAGRDYCQAYHHGPNRGEVLDLMVANGIGRDRAQLDGMMWQARDPNGLANPESLRDTRRFFKQESFVEHDPADEAVFNNDLAAAAARDLGPFRLINDSSPLKGCR